jgi:hypothetical protein
MYSVADLLWQAINLVFDMHKRSLVVRDSVKDTNISKFEVFSSA